MAPCLFKLTRLPLRIIQYIFFANYFIGILAIALAIETTFQLRLPFNSWAFYLFLFSATVFFYTRAYLSPQPVNAPTNNVRTNWYRQHRSFMLNSQWLFAAVAIGSITWQLTTHTFSIPQLPLVYWFIIVTVPIAALLYYGIWPKPFFKSTLRNVGWLKPFVIGYVWAGAVSAFPVIMLVYEQGYTTQQPGFMLWLFVKNWMFCAVNAVMFDIKDYSEDSNRHLKTFVVRVGLNKTIWLILFPLLMLGFGSFIVFSFYHNFSNSTIVLNAIPFICLLYVATRLNYQRHIFYYLVVIDGLLLVKAICGIIAALLQ